MNLPSIYKSNKSVKYKQFVLYINQIAYILMLTNELKRKKTNLYQMKTFSSNGQENAIDKLGISILNSMKQLDQKKKKIQTANTRELNILVSQYKRLQDEFLDKQKNLFSLNDNSEKITRLKNQVTRFKEQFNSQEVLTKLQTMKEDKIRQSEVKGNINLSQQIQYGKHQTLSAALLSQQQREIEIIERSVEEIKRVAENIQGSVYGQGQIIDAAVGDVREIRMKLQDARDALKQTSKYQQDSNKMKILFCILGSVIVLVVILIAIAAKK